MNLERLKFAILYRLGITPWDGHEQPTRIVELADSLPKGKALDLGCGTGDSPIFLAQKGWDVVGVDFVERALRTARTKSEAAGVKVRFVRADVARLREAGVGEGFNLLVDNGCLHLLPDPQRDAYLKEVSAVAARDARLIVLGFLPGNRGPGPRGIDRAEIERRFSDGWQLIGDGATDWTSKGGEPLHWYELGKK